jgi:hypothetical protein
MAKSKIAKDELQQEKVVMPPLLDKDLEEKIKQLEGDDAGDKEDNNA